MPELRAEMTTRHCPRDSLSESIPESLVQNLVQSIVYIIYSNPRLLGRDHPLTHTALPLGHHDVEGIPDVEAALAGREVEVLLTLSLMITVMIVFLQWYKNWLLFLQIFLKMPANMVKDRVTIMPWFWFQEVDYFRVDLEPVVSVKQLEIKWRNNELHKLGITGEGVTIAFLDSGINTNHKAFANRIVAVQNLTQYDNRDFYVDSDHGMMVASIACGASFVANEPNGDLTKILAGVAPSAKIVMYKIAAHKAHTDMITRGLKQCLRDKERYGIDIVLLPYGSKLHDVNHGPIMRELLNKNVLIVTASGNYGSAIDVSYPARLGYSICVGAHDNYGNITQNTCIGHALDFTAPGVGYKFATLGHSRAYATGKGNSCAAASVAGLVALIIQLIKDTAKIESNANQLKGYQPSVDTLVHDQHVIKKLLREIGEYNNEYQCYCIKSIHKLCDGNGLLELIYNDVYTCKT